MVKIWNEAFWKAPTTAMSAEAAARWRAAPRTRWAMLVPVAALAAITLTIGLATEPFVDFSLRAADQLLVPDGYMRAVLGQEAFP